MIGQWIITAILLQCDTLLLCFVFLLWWYLSHTCYRFSTLGPFDSHYLFMTIYGRYFFYLIIDFIISTFPIYVFLCNCMLYNVTLTTKTSILLALLTTATELGIEIILGKQSVPVVRVIGFLWSNIPRFALQSTVILVLAGTQRYYIGFHGCVTEKNVTLFSN